jgi:2-C-methyl-D-erythritol 4-phosphate cytidylyltransferase
LNKFDKETRPKFKETNPKPHEIILNDSEAWKVIRKETVVLQTRAKHTVVENVQGGNSRNPSCLLCVEAANVSTEGICVARVL